MRGDRRKACRGRRATNCPGCCARRPRVPPKNNFPVHCGTEVHSRKFSAGDQKSVAVRRSVGPEWYEAIPRYPGGRRQLVSRLLYRRKLLKTSALSIGVPFFLLSF